MLRWYLIHTKPSGEAVAQTNLERQGYQTYLPRLRQTMRRAGELLERRVALFPRYLFLGLKEGHQSLGPVRSSLGVTGVVQFGSRYAVVPDAVIGELKARADPESGLHRLNGPEERLDEGSSIRVTHGAFAGIEGIFARAAGTQRVIVLLELLGQRACVCVPRHCVLPIA